MKKFIKTTLKEFLNEQNIHKSIDEVNNDWEVIDKIIEECKLDGWGGKCGIFAIALNKVLFKNKGSYIIVTNEHLWNKDVKWIGHVCVEYGGYLYDSNGVVDDIEKIKSWGQLNEEDMNPITNIIMGEFAYDSILIDLKDDKDILDTEEFILDNLNNEEFLSSYINTMNNKV